MRGGNRPVVVFIDDESMNLTVFEAAMPEDWDIVVYDKPEQALSDIKSDKVSPWCIISDQRMPVIRGVNLLEQVKMLCPLSVRIIVTGYSEEDLVIESVRRAQIFDYIKKPWDPDDLVASVARALKFYESEMQRHSLLVELQNAHVEMERLAQFPKQIPAIMLSLNAQGELYYINPFGEFFLSKVGFGRSTFSKILPLSIEDILFNCISNNLEFNNVELKVKDRYLLWTISPDSQKHTIFCTAVDTTEKKLAEKLEIDFLAAQEADRQKTKFVANISHELKTPLNAVIGYSEILIDDITTRHKVDVDQCLKDLNRIKGSGQHLLALVNDILDIAKIEDGRLDIHFEGFQVESIVEEVVAMVRPIANKNSSKITVQNVDCPMINSDRKRVKQILLNLLSNACKFTKNGEIVVRANPSDAQLCIRVEDSGIGIREQDLKKLFNRFSQLEGANQTAEGTGLGLEISRQLAEKLGGRITVESCYGKGSVFTLILPLNSEQAKTVVSGSEEHCA